MVSRSPQARELAQTAARLREVKDAYRLFLTLWALESMASDREVLARVEADIEGQAGDGPDEPAGSELDAQLADPGNHDWSLLYRGDVLDD